MILSDIEIFVGDTTYRGLERMDLGKNCGDVENPEYLCHASHHKHIGCMTAILGDACEAVEPITK